MTVLVLEQHFLPIVEIHALIKAGSAQDPPEKAGVANLVASLLDEGTTTRSSKQLAEQIDFVGGSLEVKAGEDFTTASARVQEQVLRVIEYGEYERVGGERVLTTDVRVVAATNVDLPALAAAGGFRADLLDRLAFDVVTLPPLRARPSDILDLANEFGLAMAKTLGLPLFPGFTRAFEAQLLGHAWPGNVRELRNVVERAVYRAEGDGPIDTIALDPFESPWRPGGAVEVVREATVLPRDFAAAVAAFERDLVRRAMDAAQGNQSEAAQALGLGYHQFRRLLRKYAA